MTSHLPELFKQMDSAIMLFIYRIQTIKMAK